MTVECLVGNDLDGNCRGLIEVASRHLSEVAISQSDRVPSEVELDNSQM